ncbi:phosphocholine-specific phospholipase C [Zavarzinia sp.]|uniref:phosphocholine-specific phospholipase C n=1 Tax=Zavarzinia sp. TaxID=2027920 RepID=UPI003BB68B38
MTDTSRRDFLKSTVALSGAAAVATGFPDSIRKALAVEANNATKSIRDVEHIVILMQENRAFDHYFGTMAGVRGFGDRFTIPLPGGRNVFQQSNGSRIIAPYHLDETAGNAQRVTGTPHGWNDAHGAWDDGRMTQWPLYKRDWSMGYYRPAEIEFQWALANAFTLCDAYHCSIQSSTNPNRLFHWTGTNGPTGAGVASINNEWANLGPSSEGFTWKTYPERLQDAGVTWKVYQNLPWNFTDNPLEGFRQYRAASEKIGNTSSGFPWIPYCDAHDAKAPLYKGTSNTMPLLGLLLEFKADVKAGKLPQVSWIIAPEQYAEHPDSSCPVQGAWYVQETLNALTANPELWSKTALIVNYDENDGFFDHVPPPAVYSRDADGSAAGGATMKADLLTSEYFTHPAAEGSAGQQAPDGKVYGPGARVPCFVVSPWSRGGWVNSQVFDHTSILRFLEARFGVAETNISPYRRAICGDLTSCFDFVNPNTAVPALPRRSQIAADAMRVAQEMRAQIPIPDEASQTLPKQDVGIRPSRALPYELAADAVVEDGSVRLRLRNTGKAGAVFHVYDRLHLDRIPRRYMVEAGKQLAASWPTARDAGRYDLWVLGPNGFHRHVTGNAVETAAAKFGPEASLSYDPAHHRLNLTLTNDGTRGCTVLVTANAYEKREISQKLAAGSRKVLRLDIADQGNWYDYTVTVSGHAGFTRRFAGRMETGRDGISDPAAVFEQLAAQG